MALKAGRVGVHPSQVDRSGKISGVNAYTKAEADAKFGTKEELAAKADSAAMTEALAAKANTADVTEALAAKANTADVTEALAAKADAASVVTALAAKADQSNLTANDNDFIFAYDSTTQKYGYKAGGADTFHPFSEGGNSLFGEKSYGSSGMTATTIDVGFKAKKIIVLELNANNYINVAIYYNEDVSATTFSQITNTSNSARTIGSSAGPGGISEITDSTIKLLASSSSRSIKYMILG